MGAGSVAGWGAWRATGCGSEGCELVLGMKETYFFPISFSPLHLPLSASCTRVLPGCSMARGGWPGVPPAAHGSWPSFLPRSHLLHNLFCRLLSMVAGGPGACGASAHGPAAGVCSTPSVSATSPSPAMAASTARASAPSTAPATCRAAQGALVSEAGAGSRARTAGGSGEAARGRLGRQQCPLPTDPKGLSDQSHELQSLSPTRGPSSAMGSGQQAPAPGAPGQALAHWLSPLLTHSCRCSHYYEGAPSCLELP